MDHINSVRAALRGSAPVVAIPVPGHAPVCIRAKLLKGALKGVTIHSVELLVSLIGDRSLKITGTAQGGVHTSCTIYAMKRWEALQAIRDWTDRERKKRVKVINQGVLSAQAQRELKKKKIEGEADAVLKTAMKDEALILAAARSHANPVLEPVSAERRQSIIESYATFRAQRGVRKRASVIRWKLAKLKKERDSLTKVKFEYEQHFGRYHHYRTVKNKVTVLRRKKDAVKYAALIYQIGTLEKQYENLYPPVFGPYNCWRDSWIDKRPKDQTCRVVNGTYWRGEDQYDRKAEAQELKEARANIRALTPPADEETTQEQIAA